MRILLGTRPGITADLYSAALRELGVPFDVAFSLDEMEQLMIKNAYSGIAIDAPLQLRKSKAEQLFLREIIEIFPTIRLNCNPKTGSVQALFFGQVSKNNTLDLFINEECNHFTPRKIRSCKRFHLHFNVLLTQPETNKQPEKTVTFDISETGCFIFTTRNWETNSIISFVIKELGASMPFSGEIRRVITWGENRQVPGIGVHFINLNNDQKRWLAEICPHDG